MFQKYHDFWYDMNGYYPYFLFNGSQAVFEYVKQALTRFEMTVERAGHSRQPSSKGRQYAWFIRLMQVDGKKASLDHILQFVETLNADTEFMALWKAQPAAEPAHWPSALTPPANGTASAAEMDALAAQMAVLQEQLQKSIEERDRVRTTMDNLRTERNQQERNRLEMAGKLEILHHDAAQMQSERDALNAQIDKMRAGEQTMAELLAYIEDENADNAALAQYYAQEKDALAQKLTHYDDNLSAYESELQSLRGQIDHWQTIARRQPGSGTSARLGDVLHLFFPSEQVEFIDGSWDVLTQELSDPTNVIGHLIDIVYRKESHGKDVANLKGWRELHYSTGEGKDGRLYYLCDTGRYRVLVSYKQMQKRDIDYLKDRY